MKTLYQTIEELTETVERQAATIRRQAALIRQLQEMDGPQRKENEGHDESDRH